MIKAGMTANTVLDRIGDDELHRIRQGELPVRPTGMAEQAGCFLYISVFVQLSVGIEARVGLRDMAEETVLYS